MNKSLILSIIILCFVVFGCEEQKPVQPQNDQIDTTIEYVDGDRITSYENSYIGDIKITRINAIKGTFTILGHHQCRIGTKVQMQGDYLFIQDINRVIKKRKLLK